MIITLWFINVIFQHKYLPESFSSFLTFLLNAHCHRWRISIVLVSSLLIFFFFLLFSSSFPSFCQLNLNLDSSTEDTLINDELQCDCSSLLSRSTHSSLSLLTISYRSIVSLFLSINCLAFQLYPLEVHHHSPPFRELVRLKINNSWTVDSIKWTIEIVCEFQHLNMCRMIAIKVL